MSEEHGPACAGCQILALMAERDEWRRRAEVAESLLSEKALDVT